MLLFHLFRDLVHEPDDAPGVRLLPCIDCRAVFALAVVVPVRLRQTVVPCRPPPGVGVVGVGRDSRKHIGKRNREHVGIRKAQLRTHLEPLALHKRVILGMCVVVLVRRQHPHQRVALAELFVKRRERSAELLPVRAFVQPRADGKRLERTVVERVVQPLFEKRLFAQVKIRRHGKRAVRRDVRVVR